ncbi:MAG: transglutaminase family protein [Deltaproteobacteria bacterium]|nr:transglutaminase family protein [Deltaproteobacteria bacterium]
MKRYRIVHTTTYSFDDTVSPCKAEVHLKPRTLPHQHCEFHQLVIRPLADVTREYTDTFGNSVSSFEVASQFLTLAVTAISVVQVLQPRNREQAASSPWDEVRRRLENDDGKTISEARQFVADSQRVAASPELADYALISFTPGRSIMEASLDLMHRIHTDFIYDPGATTITTKVNEVFMQRRGVCQDFAHLAVACLRSLGLAGRYVSGYLDTAALHGANHRIASDESHAWFSVYDPEYGWVDFDPTVDRMPPDGHITTAWGRDYDDVAPLKGVFTGGGVHGLRVSVDVARI